LRDEDDFSLADTEETANKNAVGRIFIHAPASTASPPNNYRYCTGTLVSPTLVMTAARCVDPYFTAEVARDDGDVVTLTEPAFVGFGPCGDSSDDPLDTADRCNGSTIDPFPGGPSSHFETGPADLTAFRSPRNGSIPIASIRENPACQVLLAPQDRDLAFLRLTKPRLSSFDVPIRPLDVATNRVVGPRPNSFPPGAPTPIDYAAWTGEDVQQIGQDPTCLDSRTVTDASTELVSIPAGVPTTIGPFSTPVDSMMAASGYSGILSLNLVERDAGGPVI